MSEPEAMTTFGSGATRSADEDKIDPEGFLSPLVIERFCQYMHKHRKQGDGALRASDNWQKGMGRARYVKSLWRHFLDVWQLWRQRAYGNTIIRYGQPVDMEEALCAVLFNVMGLLHELLIGRDVDAPAQNSPAPCGQTEPAGNAAAYAALRELFADPTRQTSAPRKDWEVPVTTPYFGLDKT